MTPSAKVPIQGSVESRKGVGWGGRAVCLLFKYTSRESRPRHRTIERLNGKSHSGCEEDRVGGEWGGGEKCKRGEEEEEEEQDKC